jgi:ABC-type dipeptide/oligopeptide/nickel transport system permease subunit
MSRQRVVRGPFLWAAGAILVGLVAATFAAPEFLPTPILENAFKKPWEVPPLGADDRGLPLHLYALQGAGIVTFPSLLAGAIVALFATLAGLVRCLGMPWVDGAVHVIGEFTGALPRMVVILVVALMVPREWKGLVPIAVAWALLAAPGAMDEAAATAGRLGGERFVEALRAHGFSGPRIYGYHVLWLNLRPILARQAAEVAMQVVFLEIALSYLALRRNEPSFTHPDSTYSWATLLYQGYTGLLGEPLLHSLGVGLALVAIVALFAQFVRLGARAR